jgi:hypothetical protein
MATLLYDGVQDHSSRDDQKVFGLVAVRVRVLAVADYVALIEVVLSPLSMSL